MSRARSPAPERPRHAPSLLRRITGACAIVLLLSTASAWGVAPPDYAAPAQIDGVVRVDAETLIGLAAQRPELRIIDARMRGDRRHGYLEGSTSLPDIETDCETLAGAVPSLDTPVLFYCNGVSCDRSAHAVRVARGCGYRNLYWFRGGFEEWISKGYPYLRE